MPRVDCPYQLQVFNLLAKYAFVNSISSWFLFADAQRIRAIHFKASTPIPSKNRTTSMSNEVSTVRHSYVVPALSGAAG